MLFFATVYILLHTFRIMNHTKKSMNRILWVYYNIKKYEFIHVSFYSLDSSFRRINSKYEFKFLYSKF